MRLIILMMAFTALLISGCATQNSVNTNEGLNSRIKALEVKSGGQDALIVVVPSANNAISDAMMLAAIKGGTQSNAVQTLTGMLKKEGGKPIAVMGDHDGITAATIESAMDNLQGTRSTAKVFFIGDSSYGPELKKKADTLGILLEVVPYPPAE